MTITLIPFLLSTPHCPSEWRVSLDIKAFCDRFAEFHKLKNCIFFAVHRPLYDVQLSKFAQKQRLGSKWGVKPSKNSLKLPEIRKIANSAMDKEKARNADLTTFRASSQLMSCNFRFSTSTGDRYYPIHIVLATPNFLLNIG